MPHSIFIRERQGNTIRPPELIAHDIDSVTLANRLVRRIAKSCRLNGYDCSTGQRWFQHKSQVFDIYRMETDC